MKTEHTANESLAAQVQRFTDEQAQWVKVLAKPMVQRQESKPVKRNFFSFIFGVQYHAKH